MKYNQMTEIKVLYNATHDDHIVESDDDRRLATHAALMARNLLKVYKLLVDVTYAPSAGASPAVQRLCRAAIRHFGNEGVFIEPYMTVRSGKTCTYPIYHTWTLMKDQICSLPGLITNNDEIRVLAEEVADSALYIDQCLKTRVGTSATLRIQTLGTQHWLSALVPLVWPYVFYIAGNVSSELWHQWRRFAHRSPRLTPGIHRTEAWLYDNFLALWRFEHV